MSWLVVFVFDYCLQIIEQAAMREERNRIAQLMHQLLQQQQQQQQQPEAASQSCSMGQSTAIDDAIARLHEERSQLQHAVALQVPGVVLIGVCLFTFVADVHVNVIKWRDRLFVTGRCCRPAGTAAAGRCARNPNANRGVRTAAGVRAITLSSSLPRIASNIEHQAADAAGDVQRVTCDV